MKHSILSTTSTDQRNCRGALGDGGFNFASLGGGPDPSCPPSFGGVDPKLDPVGLASNGGPTETIALLADSPMRDRIPSGCPATDQRGFAREAKGFGPAVCDVGAFEVQLANDTDGDGVVNGSDACPAGFGIGVDRDGDGCKNSEDADDDGDTVPDSSDQCPAQSGVAPSGCPATGGGGTGTGGGTTRTTAAFGSDTLVSLALAARRIPARGRLRIAVSSGNAFPVIAAISAQTGRIGPRRRAVRLGTRTITVPEGARATLSMRLPATARQALQRTGKLSIRLTAKLTDPAGNVRTVRKRVTVGLKR